MISQPAFPPETPVADLPLGALFAVSALRLWAAPIRTPGRHYPDWRDSFTSAGMTDDGAPDFDTFLRIVVMHTRRPLDVRCPRCTRLGRDEAAFLHMIALLRADRGSEAATLLVDWLPHGVLGWALRYCAGFAGAMAGAGLVIPPAPSMDVPFHPTVDAGLELVH